MTSTAQGGRIAQLVEQLAFNQRVLGSSPSALTTLKAEGLASARPSACFVRAWLVVLDGVG